jgi:ferrous iron transport protein A
LPSAANLLSITCNLFLNARTLDSMNQNTSLISLSQLGRNTPARIARIESHPTSAPVGRRLLELGFDIGVDVELLHKGPFGADPLAVRVGQTTIALRSAEADLVWVTSA